MYGFWIVGIFLIICFLIAVLFDNKKLIMKILLIVALVLIAVYSFGQVPDYAYSQADLAQQTKKDTGKVKYEYYVKVPIQGYQQVIQLLNECKTWLIYNPNMPDDQKVQLFKNIDAYNNNLAKTAKVDSTKKK